MEATLGSFPKLKDSEIMKPKVLLREQRIQHPFKIIRAEGLDWVRRIQDIEEEAELNWANITASTNTNSGNTYDLKAMMSACENISGSGRLSIPKVPETASLTNDCDKLEDIFPYDGTEAQIQSPDEVNIDELACYFENMVDIPKKLSLSAEMMYT
ncbi:uncharacterized protein Dere_GG22538 [Drosophila erecta]|uniref:Oxidative stress-responsive serine-rich protein 1 n=2 Tax=Drosophila erecta TaxID=7220 RepID=B3NRT1_DROER|nr:uncharacterized protein Dere_GG22538 [Drosophila erecta]